jgi:hypothetical protein
VSLALPTVPLEVEWRLEEEEMVCPPSVEISAAACQLVVVATTVTLLFCRAFCLASTLRADSLQPPHRRVDSDLLVGRQLEALIEGHLPKESRGEALPRQSAAVEERVVRRTSVGAAFGSKLNVESEWKLEWKGIGREWIIRIIGLRVWDGAGMEC